MIEITDANFDAEVINSDTPVVVDFWAEWCGPCKMLEPVIEEVASEHSDIKFGKCNIDENDKIAMNLRISSIPTVIFVKGGEIVDQIVGAVPKQVIEEKVKALK